MALSGYMFSKPSEVVPYLEQKKKGPTSMLVSELAARLQCHVIAGYPEALEDGATAAIVNGSAPPSYSAEQVQGVVQPDAMVGYNSAVLAAPSGEIVGNYRKTFLFETDKNWSREGDGFSYFDLPAPLGRVSIGICMGECCLVDR
jgi:protein N-terminal amidase